MPSNTLIELKSSQWHIGLEPGNGLQTVFCKILHVDDWYDVMPDCTATDAPLTASNFHMLPYSNRIRDGQFNHAGTSHKLRHAEQHAIHGALRKLPWRVTAQSESSVTAEFDSRTDGEINWPWPIHAQITYTLKHDALVSQMSLTNNGSNTMPSGMGWHPYFCRSINGAEPKLTIAVSGVYPDTNGDCLPTGASIPVPQELDFSHPRDLDESQRIDHCFAGFTAPASIAWPDAGFALTMHASENCGHLILFNPDQPFFAVEPVTNANDGFNLTDKGIDAGVVELGAGETLSAQMTLQLAAIS